MCTIGLQRIELQGEGPVNVHGEAGAGPHVGPACPLGRGSEAQVLARMDRVGVLPPIGMHGIVARSPQQPSSVVCSKSGVCGGQDFVLEGLEEACMCFSPLRLDGG